MEQVKAEKRLATSYLVCSILGATTSITSGIAWGHWKSTLDQCIGRNCSCILFGEYTPSKFLGGHMAPCIWVTFGPLFYVLFTVALAGFHGYRVMFNSKSTKTRTVMSKNDAGEMVEMRAIQVEDTSPLPRSFWTTHSVITIFWSIYALVHFAVFLGGFYRTCNQYRKVLEKNLGLHGTAIPVIHGRLSCQSVYDFMDYLQPDSGYGYRDGYINTGADLIIGIIASAVVCAHFVFTAFINTTRRIRTPQEI